jgi:NAD(P)-dependent dehydrogenase (short-subunit alcohol dehydrogenase family)
VARFDALEPASAEAWLRATLDRFGRLDALINNAGRIEVVAGMKPPVVN